MRFKDIRQHKKIPVEDTGTASEDTTEVYVGKDVLFRDRKWKCEGVKIPIQNPKKVLLFLRSRKDEITTRYAPPSQVSVLLTEI